MKESWRKGFSFGLTSGIITTLGMIVGLNSSTHSQIVVIGGIVAIAIADAFSDALGIHISEEAENKHSTRQVWEATLATFMAKFFFALTFVIPVLILPLQQAIIASVVYGLSMIAIFSAVIAREQEHTVLNVVLEHISIAIAVILVTSYAGEFVAMLG